MRRRPTDASQDVPAAKKGKGGKRAAMSSDDGSDVDSSEFSSEASVDSDESSEKPKNKKQAKKDKTKKKKSAEQKKKKEQLKKKAEAASEKVDGLLKGLRAQLSSEYIDDIDEEDASEVRALAKRLRSLQKRCLAACKSGDDDGWSAEVKDLDTKAIKKSSSTLAKKLAKAKKSAA